MSAFWIGLGIGLTVFVVKWVYDAFAKCDGGHLYTDWEATDRWKTIPHDGRDIVAVERMYERDCRHSDCHHTESKWEYHEKETDATRLNEKLIEIVDYDD